MPDVEITNGSDTTPLEEKYGDWVRRLAKTKGLAPLTPREADAVMEAAREEPLSDSEIDRILESVRRGKMQAQVDKAAREELKRITPPNEELLKLADRFPAPQEWYDE
jgi:hypothetical protein